MGVAVKLLLEYRCFTGIFQVGTKSVNNEIEKGRQRGEAISFCILLGSSSKFCEKGKDIVLRN
jgi:hypothetical protein